MNKQNQIRLIKLQIFLGGLSEDETLAKMFKLIKFYKLRQDLRDLK